MSTWYWEEIYKVSLGVSKKVSFLSYLMGVCDVVSQLFLIILIYFCFD